MKIDDKIIFGVESNAHISLHFSDVQIIRELCERYEKDRESLRLTAKIFFFDKDPKRKHIKRHFLHVFCKHKKPKWCQEKTKQKACFF